MDFSSCDINIANPVTYNYSYSFSYTWFFIIFCYVVHIQSIYKNVHMCSQLENRVFLGCSPAIFKKLDVSAILPYLHEKDMLTDKDYQMLISKSIIDYDKIEYLMDILPRKGDDFFGKFMYCLCMSKPGTGHDDIVKALHRLKAKLEEDNRNNEMGNASDLQGAEEEDENKVNLLY